MILYHVSMTPKVKFPKKLYPRIPDDDSRMMGEDGFTKRICFSSEIDKAFSALPKMWHEAEGMDIENLKCLISVFRMDTSKYDIKQENIITPNQLLREGKVQDAYLTQEHWIIEQEIIPLDEDVVEMYATIEELGVYDLYNFELITKVLDENEDVSQFMDTLANLCDQEEVFIDDYTEGWFPLPDVIDFEEI